MDKTWEVDEANTVKARFGAFGRKVVKVNDAEVYDSRKAIRKEGIVFTLPDGRGAAISLRRPFIGRPAIDLRVGGNLVTETGKKPIACAACGTAAKPYDRFCASCGHAMPTAEDRELEKRVKEATGAIMFLAGLFLVFGIAMFFVTKHQSDAVAAKFDGMDASAVLPYKVEGKTYTVAEVRKAIAWEAWGVLIVNLILAVIMAALAVWAKRAPLPAVLIAAATYAVVLVLNAISNPATIAQGLILKIIIIAFLAKGIKAALELRAANA